MTLTPAERGAVLLVVGLLALGTLWVLRPQGLSRPPRAGASRVTIDPTVADSEPVRAARSTPPAAAPPLDLNRATPEELDALPGVGPVLAGRIIEQRRRQGGFHDVRDLRAVRGIGPRLYARLQGLVEVRPLGPSH